MPHTKARRTTRGSLAILSAAALAALAAASPVGAKERPTDPALERCAGDTGERLRFLERRLDAHRGYADAWWKAWSGVYVGGIVVGGASAGMADDRGERADQIVTAVKAGIGLTRNLLSPPPAREGARELEGIDTSTAAGCAQRLARAQEILQESAAAARRERRSWIPHLANLGLNLAGAVIVAEGFDESSGWTSGAVGFAVGEGRIWSYPWQAGSVLEEYERRFPRSGIPQEPATSWQLESWGGGARFVLRY
jgi:hypothetical protein